MKDADNVKIERTKGLFGQVSRDYPDAIHHFKIFFNDEGKARLIYKNSEFDNVHQEHQKMLDDMTLRRGRA